MKTIRLALLPALLLVVAFATMAPHFSSWNTLVFDVVVTSPNADGTDEHLGEFKTLLIQGTDGGPGAANFNVDVDQNDALKQWVERCYQDAAATCRKDLIVSFVSRDGAEARTINLFYCYPVDYSASAQGSSKAATTRRSSRGSGATSTPRWS